MRLLCSLSSIASSSLMSHPPHTPPSPKTSLTVPLFQARKGEKPLVGLAVATAPLTRIVDPLLDFILVGDSLGMTLYGYDSTLPVTLEMMIRHGEAVARTAQHAMVVVDMPFGSYQQSPQQAFANAARIMAETGCAAVKLEGGMAMAETVAFLVARGIPVMGHVGLTPQSVHVLGGYRARGRDATERDSVMRDAHAIADAGAFALVIEAVREPIARAITEEVQIPTIGIGASPMCDGQVLVIDDLIGMFDQTPRFATRYAALDTTIADSVATWAMDVRARTFPRPENCFGMMTKEEI